MECKENDKKCLKTSIFERIESEQVSPRSRWFFHSRECVVWFFWGISVLIGALAVGISLFVMIHHQYALYEATHENFFTFLVDVLPYLWFMVFGLMIAVAVFNLRHTKRGYRWPMWMIIASSMVFSFAGGSAIHLFGLGHEVDELLGSHLGMYTSQSKLEQIMWQVPSEGRLIGRQVYTTVQPTSTIIFEDTTGARWRVDLSELSTRDMDLLASEQTVRLLGVPTEGEVKIFHACGAMPWMLEPKVTVKDMSTEREEFIERVTLHARPPEPIFVHKEGDALASTTLAEIGPCAESAAVRRMPVRPQ
ncbi:MAG: hypothetical protein KC877_01765 [Candidatus Kaiserbacteria bacterium]|nr:hypothetical protein [Candidatus Kaiserbacteria bacterium]MCB9815923.1 hypothetical protein [Candidatus Nomurabacteria bacterium]